MKISFFELEGWEESHIKKQLAGNELALSKEKFDAEKAKDSDIVSIFVNSKLDKKDFDKLKKVKMIATQSTGFDHIDIVEAKKKGVVVSTVPHYGENTVAEHSFALLLAISRKIVESVERTKKGVFDYHGLRGFDLNKKTIGIIGTGNIGKNAVRIAHGFEMNILAFDVFKNDELVKKYGLQYVDLDTLLQKSDVIMFHVPLLPQTKHMLNLNNYKKIKKGAVVINTSRGGVVETEALLRALDEKYVSFAGLDVVEEEHNMKDKHMQSLLKHQNVIITPHNAFNTHEAVMRILQTTIDNIKAFIAGKPQNTVK